MIGVNFPKLTADLQLFESEMRCAVIEAETREEVMREMEARMKKMEEIYTRRLMKEVCWIALFSRIILKTMIGSIVGAE